MGKTFHFKSIFYILLLAVLSLNTLAVLILSCVPPVSRDALVHHLAIPKLWLKHGGIYEIPDMVISYYPMNLDLLYMIPLYFENDIFPKGVNHTIYITRLNFWNLG